MFRASICPSSGVLGCIRIMLLHMVFSTRCCGWGSEEPVCSLVHWYKLLHQVGISRQFHIWCTDTHKSNFHSIVWANILCLQWQSFKTHKSSSCSNRADIDVETCGTYDYHFAWKDHNIFEAAERKINGISEKHAKISGPRY